MKRWLYTATVTAAERKGPFRKTVLDAPPIAGNLKPGQFVTLDLGTPLRQSLLPSAIRPEEIEALVPPDHPVAALQPGSRIGAMGPIGKPFHLPEPPGRLLLLADVTHLPILIPAANKALADGCSTALLLSAKTVSHLYPLELLPPALEVHLVTADGSAGHSGSFLEMLPDLLLWCDQLLVALEPAQYPLIAESVRTTRLRPDPAFAQAVLQPLTICGVGACQGCAVSTRDGIRLACTDGPAYDLLRMEDV